MSAIFIKIFCSTVCYRVSAKLNQFLQPDFIFPSVKMPIRFTAPDSLRHSKGGGGEEKSVCLELKGGA